MSCQVLLQYDHLKMSDVHAEDEGVAWFVEATCGVDEVVGDQVATLTRLKRGRSLLTTKLADLIQLT